jgi:cyclopropane fatty-acyl-phospholipid synthase-like methyltransferase
VQVSSRRRSNKVVFLHIGKTGGTTFNGVLSSIFGDSFHFCDDPSIEGIARALESFDCIEFHTLLRRGDWVHMHGELAAQHRWELIDGADIFTMFREPVDQAISLYFHLIEFRERVEPTCKANGVAFPESLEQFAESPWYFNNQLAFLVGKNQMTSKKLVGPKDLDYAKDILLNLQVHAGLTERYADALHVFETVTGRRIPGRSVECRNQNSKRPSLDAIPFDLKERIRRQSALDIELYEFGRGLLEKDLARCGSAPVYHFEGVPNTRQSEVGDAIRDARKPIKAQDPASVKKYYDETTAAYIEGFGEVFQGSRPESTEDLLNYLVEAAGLLDGMKILDAGCGVCGPAIWFAEHRNLKVEALTLSPVQVHEAKARVAARGLTNRITVREGDFHRLAKLYRPETFDRVLYLETICHARDYRQVLTEAMRVLKPGGYLYIKDFYCQDFRSKPELLMAQLEDLRKLNSFYRLVLPDMASTIDLLSELGFRINYVREPRYAAVFGPWIKFEQTLGLGWKPELSHLDLISAMEIFCRKPLPAPSRAEKQVGRSSTENKGFIGWIRAHLGSSKSFAPMPPTKGRHSANARTSLLS